MKKNVNDPYIAWQKFIVKHSQSVILKKLEQLIQDDGGLFKNDPAIQEFRNLSLLFRIDLLIEWGRYAEALAWLCLETELNPTNVEALAMKEQLKKQLQFITEENYVSIQNTSNNPVFNWSPVAGMRRIKAIIERDVLLPLKERELYKNFNVSIPQGLLLYGPPGCGKTFIVKRIAGLLGFKYFEVSPSTIASTYVHGTQEKIKSLFDEAAKNKPVLLFIDELEAFVPNRSRTDVSFHYQAEVNEFLVQLNNAHKNGIFVVGATNHINMIDEAIKRPGRFDKKIFVGPPDIEARIEAFKTYLKHKPQNISKWLYIAEETENYTFAEIQFVVEETARIVVSKKKTMIDLNELMKVILDNPPELSEKKLLSFALC
ncbi:MAG: ATP-binding protein [Prolixibacteraceae bacterium]|jgi:transitional endoplasmic reticulum ATPase|nr:ATP-binding protein [Prolixibacteraceae bacterium]MBT6004735.1 ATP-binding protein [Prolixibacteraceae bacterium]MBT6763299.1 ATP-binding protein [Prolixibacteraceae bacterium]MBT6997836.1 ATP-binding protein [Prolixibacteraceae bacterium]MBT7394200.1 ATP-binding protein [Prolixibacteraceae bacterium]